MMKNDEIILKANIKKAIRIVANIEEKYQIEAFKIILPHLIHNLGNHANQNEKLDEKEIALSELIARVKPDTYTKTALLICYYLYKSMKIISFNIDTIKNEFDGVRAVKPKNMTDTLNLLIKKGFLRSSSNIDGKKGFEITKTGIQYVEKFIT